LPPTITPRAFQLLSRQVKERNSTVLDILAVLCIHLQKSCLTNDSLNFCTEQMQRVIYLTNADEDEDNAK
jgi:hypothetical protein